MTDRIALLRRVGALQKASPTDSTENPKAHRVDKPPGAGWKCLGRYVYSRRTEQRSRLANDDAPLGLLCRQPLDMNGAVFFDTETTGLSGGAGSLAFLIGVGRIERGRIIVRQFFLTDYPGEAEFLGLALEELGNGPLWVSYNGKSFDSHLLRSRTAMNGMHLEVPDQLDLLHLVRRLWGRTLPDCGLGTVEHHVLSRERGEDIPGWQVPDAYFEYLRTGRDSTLHRVFEHNRHDIVALVELAGLIVSMMESGTPACGIDPTALAELVMPVDAEAGLRLLGRAVESGDARAGRILSLHLKRNGDWTGALPIWTAMVSRGSGFAAIELAKYWEHRRRNPSEALACLDRLWRNLPVPARLADDVRRRRRRLQQKIRRAGG